MASDLYRQLGGKSERNENVSLKQLMDFSRSLGGKNPKNIVEGLLKSGAMSQEEFNGYVEQANKILGG